MGSNKTETGKFSSPGKRNALTFIADLIKMHIPIGPIAIIGILSFKLTIMLVNGDIVDIDDFLVAILTVPCMILGFIYGALSAIYFAIGVPYNIISLIIAYCYKDNISPFDDAI